MKTQHNPWVRFLEFARHLVFVTTPLAIFSVVSVIGATNARAGANIDYVLTTRTDSVKPGAVAEFVLMVTNHEISAQAVIMEFDVPPNTTYLGDTAGTHEAQRIPTSNANIPSGATQGYVFRFNVLGANQSPPDDTPITLILNDNNRGAMVQRTVIVQSAPILDLQLSTAQSSVAPSANFTYRLSFHNPGAMAASNVDLSMAIPPGASLISASDGGMLGNDGKVHWPLPLNMLSAGATGQRTATFASPAGITGALPIEATLSDGAGDTATSSTTMLETTNAMPDLVYTLTSKSDPVRPGEVAEFVLMVTNHTSSLEPVIVSFTVPEHTTYGSIGFDDDPGTAESQRIPTSNAYIPGEATEGYIFRLNVQGGNVSPPDGTIITLPLVDVNHGTTISRSVVVRSAPKIDLQLSTGQASVAPGANFTYLLSYSTATATATNVQLSAALPPGTTFVSASNSGVLGNDGVVRWSLNTLNPRVNGQRTLILNAPATPFGELLVEATLSDTAGDVARSSTTMLEDTNAMPDITYTLSAPNAPVLPGTVVEFPLTATNHTTDLQTVIMTFTVPNYTTYGSGDPPGTAEGQRIPQPNANIPPGTTQGFVFRLTIPGLNQSPPNGTLITLALTDLNRGTTISRTIVVRSLTSAKADFNADTRPDWVLQSPSTRQTQIWLMNNGVRSSAFVGPTLPLHWALIDTDQFNAASSTDLLLFNASTRQTAVWYMNGARFLSARSGPTLPAGYTLVLSHDFNGDGRPDLLIYNGATHQLAVWYLNNLVQHTSDAVGPTLPAGWFVFGVADFNQDGNPDLLIWNPTRRSSGIWYLTNLTYSGSGYGPAFAPGWVPAALDDFNRDGHPDLAVANPSTHQTAIWYLNNNVRFSSKFGPMTPAGFLLTAPR